MTKILKHKIIILIFIITKLSFGQELFSENNLIEKSNQIINKHSALIESKEKKDTTYGPNYLEMTHYYDKNKKLIKRVNLKPYSSIGFTGPRTEIYDENLNLILEKNEDHSGVIWRLSLNEYDKIGNLTKRTLFDMEYIYTELYEYNSRNKLIKTTIYNNYGRKVNSYKKTKRKEPYKLE